MNSELRPDWHIALPTRLAADAGETQAILAAHDEAEAAGRGGYLDPSTGLFVMTATQLAERGYCCGNRCRHCPYEPDRDQP